MSIPDPTRWLDRLHDVGPQQHTVIRGRMDRRRVTLADLRRLRIARAVRREAMRRRTAMLPRIYGEQGGGGL